MTSHWRVPAYGVIEETRAGEAGRGFAVVASEVKLLAGRSTALTQGIAKQIANIQTSTDVAVQAILAISDTIAQAAAAQVAGASG